VCTRYVYLILRTLADAVDPADVKKANALQEGIQWDPVSQSKGRNVLLSLGSPDTKIQRVRALSLSNRYESLPTADLER
jgi:hypothetical protein